MSKGIVFDIQRCSIHDGPGIRTTVFLKGCPLRCVWCHNPESYSKKPVLFYYDEKCTNCGSCKKVCKHGVHTFTSDGHFIDRSKCTACGRCVDACLTSALEIKGTEMSASDVLKEVLKDKKFFDNSGGGITISGGEPFFQYDFMIKLLKKCVDAGIQTCVETCGLADETDFRKALKYIDVLLFDYKVTDPQLHKKLTGHSNKLILKNLDSAYNAGKKIYLRSPLVPGYNVDETHFDGIAKLSRKYPDLAGIEIMPYHNMGESKAQRSGIEPSMPNMESVSDEQKAKWEKLLERKGCKLTVG